MQVHNVFFSLKDKSPEAAKKLVDACGSLSSIDGIRFFASGTLADLERPLNDRDFDVSLLVVFESRAAHDAYQVAPEHNKFLEDNKDGWEKVRIFDTDVES